MKPLDFEYFVFKGYVLLSPRGKGAVDYLNGKQFSSNPYDHNSDNGLEWSRGWEDEHDRVGVELGII